MRLLRFLGLLLCFILMCVPQVGQAQSGTGLFVPTGPVQVAAGAVGLNEELATIPVTHVRRGKLKEALVIDQFRVPAGTPLYAVVLGRTGSESITAWCGLFEARALMSWSQTAACIVARPDGQANIVEADGFGNQVVSWYIERLNIQSPSKPFSMPQIEPDQDPGLDIKLVLRVAAVQGTRFTLSRVFVGPASSRRSNSVVLDQIILNLSNSPANINVIGSQIEIALGPLGKVTAKLLGQAPQSSIVGQSKETGAAAELFPTPQRQKPTDFVVQSLLMDPAQIRARAGPIDSGGVLAAGPARLWQTGTLETGFVKRAGTGLGTSADAGTQMQRVEVFLLKPLGLRETRFYWCGLFNISAYGLNVKRPNCLSSSNAGITMLYGSLMRGKPIVLVANSLLPPEPIYKPLTVAFDPQSPTQDLVSEILLKKSSRTKVEIAIVAGREANRDEIFLIELPWSADGKVMLPFWTHSLTLTRTANGAEAQWNRDNPGLGPVEARIMLQAERN
jgi:hypothetical protein